MDLQSFGPACNGKKPIPNSMSHHSYSLHYYKMPHHSPPISTNPSPKGGPHTKTPSILLNFQCSDFGQTAKNKGQNEDATPDYINTNNAYSWHFDKWYCGRVDKNSEQKAPYIKNATYSSQNCMLLKKKKNKF